ncbi:MAG: polyphosphate polymerase domain-containing protein [Coriobacteriales bacterium]|nr:polyphosphate polymerase domain-containing protein [Coriobacteriales bacterium]
MADLQNFKRKETKYLISTAQKEAFLKFAGDKLIPDFYPISHIDSIYFDTQDYYLIRRSIEKPLYKEKLRIRAYEDITPNSKTFIEQKKKYDGIVYKRRVSLPYSLARDFINGSDYEDLVKKSDIASRQEEQEQFRDTNMQISRELRAFIDRYKPLTPAFEIKYTRHSFAYNLEAQDAKEMYKNLRLTLDSNLQYKCMRTEDAVLQDLLDSDLNVLEIKSDDAYPVWLADYLNQEKIHPRSFSKSATTYLKISQEKCPGDGNEEV